MADTGFTADRAAGPRARYDADLEREDFVRDHLAPSMVGRRGLLREATVARLQREHFAGERDHGWALWRLLNLELWYQAFVDGSGSPISAV